MKIINISSYLAIVTLLVLITIPSSESYTNHTVGGASGWYFNRSSNKSITDYSKWASGKTFNLGDYLIFDTNTNQTVIQTYNETAYKICNADDTTDASVYSGGAEIGKQVVLSVPLIIEGADSCPMEFPRCSIETYFLTMAREKIKEKSKTCN
ncbi:hypothetical protein C5167_046417 [Papaver somniferum]|uniref:Phytocyanin domain-containing protein n=1 Tax=Papaver somniferum TaxID=3469 RepID=A0A4Y7LGG1_PAPSO|nr:hypothetical protein C5167_046417 [Papaver somniferum]